MASLKHELIRLAFMREDLRPYVLAALGHRVALNFPSQNALDAYLKEHPAADKSLHHVRETQERPPKSEEKPKEQPTGKPEDKNPKEQKPQEEDTHVADPRGEEGAALSQKKVLTKAEVPSGGSATGTPMDMDGDLEKPAGYDVMTGHRGIAFYKRVQDDLDAVQKRVKGEAYAMAHEAAIGKGREQGLTGEALQAYAEKLAGKIAEKKAKAAMMKHLDDTYGSMLADPAIQAYQMNHELRKYVDRKVSYTPLSNKPLTEDSEEALKTIKENAMKVRERFARALPGEYKKGLMTLASDLLDETLRHALRDGSLRKVTEQEVSDMVVTSLEQLVYQDLESSKRLVSDHGTRHVVTNMKSSLDILDALAKSGTTVSGADRFAAMFAMLHHDLGYTTPATKDAAAGTPLMKAHPQFSQELIKRNPFWKKAFGDRASTYLDEMSQHSRTDVDWEERPWASAIRLADATAVFADEKLPDLLAANPRTASILGKMLVDQQSGGPRRFGEEDWDSEESKATFEDLRKEMIDAVDDLDVEDDIKESLRESLHKDLTPHTPDFLLGMYGGRKGQLQVSKGPDGRKQVVMNIEATPDRQVLDSLFGHTADFQTERLLDDFDIKGDPVRQGLEFFNLPDVEEKNGKPEFVAHGPESGLKFRFNTRHTDNPAALGGIFGKEFGDASIRGPLLTYARRMAGNVDDATREQARKDLMKAVHGRMDEDETAALEKHLDKDFSTGISEKESLSNPIILAREIIRFPLTQRERQLLKGPGSSKKASYMTQVPVGYCNFDGKWIEPHFRKCPAVNSFEVVLGHVAPNPARVDASPVFKGLPYDFGHVACRIGDKQCPWFKGTVGEDNEGCGKKVLCAFRLTK